MSDITTARALAHSHVGACKGEHIWACDLLTVEFGYLFREISELRDRIAAYEAANLGAMATQPAATSTPPATPTCELCNGTKVVRTCPLDCNEDEDGCEWHPAKACAACAVTGGAAPPVPQPFLADVTKKGSPPGAPPTPNAPGPWKPDTRNPAPPTPAPGMCPTCRHPHMDRCDWRVEGGYLCGCSLREYAPTGPTETPACRRWCGKTCGSGDGDECYPVTGKSCFCTPACRDAVKSLNPAAQQAPCGTCGGYGFTTTDRDEQCPACNGTGLGPACAPQRGPQ